MYHTEGHSLCYWQGSRTIDMLTLLQGFVFQNWLDLREAFKYSEFFPPCTENTLTPEKISHTRDNYGVFAQYKVWNGARTEKC